ncbi:TlpA family protein disulfide reductase [Sphingomonas donggukensis]|uniref:TlpA family protein disulfide reductase n=1 Tax=Sphingomonas donggukensis TaxID=2949093 RepID=A0ABY4TT32_9SPHN|nr:TlpA disulfide reductase family protein [Sphingomonas donggukensis]URW75572.1 TlpA family protein disulfide reductase [Sphingomonas donggukensis]
MRSTIVPVLLCALLAGGCDRQSAPGSQGNVLDAANVASADEVQPDEATAGPAAPKAGTFDASHKGEAAPAHAFADPSGATKTLADFRGNPVLVNLWATWCIPCIRELPTLDALAAREGGKLQVVLLSQDTDASKVAPFVAKRGLKAATAYTDAKMAWLPSVTATLPTTILYDAAGKEVWRVVGDRDWSGEEAAEAIATAQ